MLARPASRLRTSRSFRPRPSGPWSPSCEQQPGSRKIPVYLLCMSVGILEEEEESIVSWRRVPCPQLLATRVQRPQRPRHGHGVPRRLRASAADNGFAGFLRRSRVSDRRRRCGGLDVFEMVMRCV